jgi:hypothetical protein
MVRIDSSFERKEERVRGQRVSAQSEEIEARTE